MRRRKPRSDLAPTDPAQTPYMHAWGNARSLTHNLAPVLLVKDTVQNHDVAGVSPGPSETLHCALVKHDVERDARRVGQGDVGERLPWPVQAVRHCKGPRHAVHRVRHAHPRVPLHGGCKDGRLQPGLVRGGPQLREVGDVGATAQDNATAARERMWPGGVGRGGRCRAGTHGVREHRPGQGAVHRDDAGRLRDDGIHRALQVPVARSGKRLLRRPTAPNCRSAHCSHRCSSSQCPARMTHDEEHS